jgi:hypothetical protein
LGMIDLEDIIIDRLEVRHALVNEVILGQGSLESSITFRNCIINRVSGVASEEGLPTRMFIDCEVSEFDDMSTNTAVLRSPLSPPMKGLITVLRKLYMQAGGGRQINALKRGISQGAILESIDDVLRILEGENLIIVSNAIAHPVRRQTHRIRQILSAPNLSTDPIVLKVKQIQV